MNRARMADWRTTSRRIGGLLTFAGTGSTIVGVVARDDGLEPGLKAGIDGQWTNGAILVGLALVTLAVLLLAATYQTRASRMRSPTDPHQEARAQRRRAGMLVLYSIVLMVASFGASLEIHRSMVGVERDGDGQLLGVVIAYAWLVPIILMGWDWQSIRDRRWLNDELSRQMRTRAVMVSFFVLLLGVTTALVLTILQPVWGLMALPPTLGLAVSAAGLSFVWLDWKAGRGG